MPTSYTTPSAQPHTSYAPLGQPLASGSTTIPANTVPSPAPSHVSHPTNETENLRQELAQLRNRYNHLEHQLHQQLQQPAPQQQPSPSRPPSTTDDSIKMLKVFSSVSTLHASSAIDNFHSWKDGVASALLNSAEWSKLVHTTVPTVSFIPTPVPPYLSTYNASLALAIRSKLDDAAKVFLPPHVTGGLEMIQCLESAFNTTITPFDEHNQPNQLCNPCRCLWETPLQYYTRLVQIQRKLQEKGTTIPIKPFSFTCGLVVNSQKSTKTGKPFYSDEIFHLKKYGQWPSRWEVAKANLPQLTAIINHGHRSLVPRNDSNEGGGGRGHPNRDAGRGSGRGRGRGRGESFQYTENHQRSPEEIQAIVTAINTDRQSFIRNRLP